ncbi:chitinase [Ganoderma leucocontextum]|nr:chitinase [Ganoderma leucocontextum]
MFSSARMITSILAALTLASVSSMVVAAPAPTDLDGHSSGGSHSRFVIYSDNFVSGGLPPASTLKGYNVVALSFLTCKGALDQAANYAGLSASAKKAKSSEYHKAGIKIMVSAFGSTDTPTSSGANAVDTANTMAKFVKSHGLDGIDVDYEDLAAMNKGDGKAEEWLTSFTQTLRKTLPKGHYLLSHAPLAPWLAPNKAFAAGAYVKVNKNVGHLIDWYNVQFYNQNLYSDCESLITKSGGTWPGSSLFEIPKHGIPLNKLVIGKPATSADASNGYMSPAQLGTCVKQAHAKGWKGGVMVWQYPHANAEWIKAAKGSL